MTDMTMRDKAATPLQPIKVSLLENWRLMRRQYHHPLEHAQELQTRYGNAVMRKIGP